MRFHRNGSVVFAALCAIVIAVLLVPGTAHSGPVRSDGRVLRVAAAASLSFAFAEIVPAFERETGTDVAVSLGSTGMLAKQVEHGAPFDLFFAADESYIRALEEKGLVVDGSNRVYAEGRLALVVHTGSGIEVSDITELALPRVRRIAIANPEHAPYGRAAMEAMRAAGVWEAVRGRLVYGENVRQALRFVQTGNAPVGITALSVADAPGVTFTPVDPSLHAPVSQAAAVIKGTGMEQAARDFIDFVTGPKGRPVMEKFGFYPPGGN